MDMETPILIVGGGPVGLTLSLELSAWSVEHILVSSNTETSIHPKCNLANARSMEHFRRLGVSKTLRAKGLPNDHPQDSVYFIKLGEAEICRFETPSSDRFLSGDHDLGEIWPTPEPPYRISQIFTEQVLKAKAQRSDHACIRFGHELLSFEQSSEHVRAVIKDTKSDKDYTITSDWIIGCDGAHSAVRKLSEIRYEGESKVKRRIFGGTMRATYFRSPDLAEIMKDSPPGHMLWTMGPKGRTATVVINGVDTFLNHIQLPHGDDPENWDPHDYIPQLVGRPVDIEIITSAIWNAGYALTAERFRRGRALIAGDAAHLFTPTGGFGMNTGIDDVANLGWKLAGMVQGWGNEALLDTYEAERKPIGVRNTNAAKAIADIMASVEIPEAVEIDGPKGDAARAELASNLLEMAKHEFNTSGVQLGVRYEASPLTISDGSPATPDAPNTYVPTARPGSRAPHTKVRSRGTILDRFGPHFTLLAFKDLPEDMAKFEKAAAKIGAPLKSIRIKDNKVAALYERALVLVRPDGHVSWRGDHAQDADAILSTATGNDLVPEQIEAPIAVTAL